MRKIIFLLLISLFPFVLIGQNLIDSIAVNSGYKNWTLTAGMDLTQILQINPQVGQGDSRINLGIDLNVQHRIPGVKSFWTKSLVVDYVVQRVGSGNSPFNDTVKVAFQKTTDLIRFSSHYAQLLPHPSQKLFWGIDAFAGTQLTKTFEGNLLKDLTQLGPLARFLSPLTTTLGGGISYRPAGLAAEQERFYMYYSPLTWKMILVADESIAVKPAINTINSESEFLGSFHGNPLEIDSVTMTVTSFKKSRMLLGSFFRFRFDDILFRDRLRTDGFTLRWDADLTLFLDYLNAPFQLDIDWRNTFSAKIYRGLELSLLIQLFYDQDRVLQKTNTDINNTNSTNMSRYTKGINFTERILLRYRLDF